MTARNTTVVADANAPAITQLLAEFVASHPSKGWSDAVEAQAHRTFSNWAGCAVGPSTHETMEAALGAVKELAPSAQASVLGAELTASTWPMRLCSMASVHTLLTLTTRI
jgi:2-methylcitrate dehydratase PrpD